MAQSDLFIQGLKVQKPFRLGLRSVAPASKVEVYDSQHKFLRYEPPTFWDRTLNKGVSDNGYETSQW